MVLRAPSRSCPLCCLHHPGAHRHHPAVPAPIRAPCRPSSPRCARFRMRVGKKAPGRQKYWKRPKPSSASTLSRPASLPADARPDARSVRHVRDHRRLLHLRWHLHARGEAADHLGPSRPNHRDRELDRLRCSAVASNSCANYQNRLIVGAFVTAIVLMVALGSSSRCACPSSATCLT